MIYSRPENPTDEEVALAQEARIALQARFPRARIEVAIRICCPEVADTLMRCNDEFGHSGNHHIYCKGHEW